MDTLENPVYLTTLERFMPVVCFSEVLLREYCKPWGPLITEEPESIDSLAPLLRVILPDSLSLTFIRLTIVGLFRCYASGDGSRQGDFNDIAHYEGNSAHTKEGGKGDRFSLDQVEP